MAVVYMTEARQRAALPYLPYCWMATLVRCMNSLSSSPTSPGTLRYLTLQKRAKPKLDRYTCGSHGAGPRMPQLDMAATQRWPRGGGEGKGHAEAGRAVHVAQRMWLRTSWSLGPWRGAGLTVRGLKDVTTTYRRMSNFLPPTSSGLSMYLPGEKQQDGAGLRHRHVTRMWWVPKRALYGVAHQRAVPGHQCSVWIHARHSARSSKVVLPALTWIRRSSPRTPLEPAAGWTPTSA